MWFFFLIPVSSTERISDGVGSRRFYNPPSFLVNIHHKQIKLLKLGKPLLLNVRCSLLTHVLIRALCRRFLWLTYSPPIYLLLNKIIGICLQLSKFPREHLCDCDCCCFTCYVVYMRDCLSTLGSTSAKCIVACHNTLVMIELKIWMFTTSLSSWIWA